MEPKTNRRTFLTTAVATTTTLLSGCAGFLSESSNSGNPDEVDNRSDSIDTLTITTTIDITLSNKADIDRIRLIGPDGSAHTSTDVETGATKVSLPVFDTMENDREDYAYVPGKNTLALIRDGEVVEEQPLVLEPKIQISNVTSSNGNVVYEFSNVGSAPVYINDLVTTEAGNSYEDQKDAINEFTVKSEEKSPIIIPDKSKQIRDYEDETFRFPREEYDLETVCSSNKSTKDVLCAVQIPNLGWVEAELTISASELVDTGRDMTMNYGDCGGLSSKELPVTLTTNEDTK